MKYEKPLITLRETCAPTCLVNNSLVNSPRERQAVCVRERERESPFSWENPSDTGIAREKFLNCWRQSKRIPDVGGPYRGLYSFSSSSCGSSFQSLSCRRDVVAVVASVVVVVVVVAALHLVVVGAAGSTATATKSHTSRKQQHQALSASEQQLNKRKLQQQKKRNELAKRKIHLRIWNAAHIVIYIYIYSHTYKHIYIDIYVYVIHTQIYIKSKCKPIVI